jgi:uncharacterized protein YjbI with pentapeptide repeats
VRRLFAAGVVLVIAACASTPPTQTASPTPSGAVPSSAPTGAPSGGPTTQPTAGPTPHGPTIAPPSGAPTDAPAGEVPAGAQFGEPVSLPDSSQWSGPTVVAPDGTMLITGYRLGAKRGLVPSQNAHALVGSPETGWQDVEMGGVDIANPPGHPNVRGGGAVPRSIVLGESGYVAVGRAMFFDRNYGDATVVAAIWHSPDGLDWQFIDPRGLVGGGKVFQLRTVVAVPGGYVAAGSVADSTSDLISLQIIKSTNGVDWQALSTIDGTWSLEAGSLYLKGDELLLSGWELVCQDDASHISTFAWAPALQAWHSSDGGATWQDLDLTASGVITQPEPAPTKKSDCPSGPEQAQRFRTNGNVEGVFDGQVVVSGLLGQLATSTDLSSWQQITLPGAAAEGEQSIISQLVTSGPAGLQLTSLESWRNPLDDHAMAGGWQSAIWQIPSSGGEPVRVPAARPMLPGEGNTRLIEGPAGEIWLLQIEGTSTELPKGLTMFRRSVAGPLEPWGTCTPGPGADCSFTVAPLVALGADLTGIDLRASRVTNGDLTGADMAGALLENATIFASLDNADLTGVNAVNTSFYGTMDGANVSSADFTGARVDASFFNTQRDDSTVAAEMVVWIDPGQTLEGYDFSGQNLGGFAFHGSDGGSMRDADFSGADLRSASFSSVDLTGADFDGAKLDGSYFGSDTICPDGQPVDSSKFGAASCRIN